MTPAASATKSSKPRLLHNTHYGLICPSETPEGEKIGVVKNFALMTKVSLGFDNSEIEK
jgi:DNA-directed RNA polymerase II subunit RPB2